MDIETGIAAVVSLLSFGGLVSVGRYVDKEKKNLKELKEAKVYFPSTLNKKISDPKFYTKLKENPDNPKEYIMRGFVEGYVYCRNPIKAQLNDKVNLVYSKVSKSDVRSNDFLLNVDERDSLHEHEKNIKAPLYFHLRDPDESYTVQVNKNYQVKTDQVLEKITEKTTLKELSGIEEFLVQVGKVFGVLGLFSRNLLFRGFKIGYNEIEEGITVGSPLSVYGDVIYNITEKTLKIESPIAFLKDKFLLIKESENAISDASIGYFFLSIPFLISTGYLVYRGYKKYVEKRLNQNRVQTPV